MRNCQLTYFYDITTLLTFFFHFLIDLLMDISHILIVTKQKPRV